MSALKTNQRYLEFSVEIWITNRQQADGSGHSAARKQIQESSWHKSDTSKQKSAKRYALCLPGICVNRRESVVNIFSRLALCVKGKFQICLVRFLRILSTLFCYSPRVARLPLEHSLYLLVGYSTLDPGQTFRHIPKTWHQARQQVT